jgi:NitT/TauT family transport system permease protein
MNIKRVVCHLVFVAVLLSLWELMAQRGLLDPLFFGRPLGIATYLWDGLFVNCKLWRELGYTVAGASISFMLGSLGAVALGMLFIAAPRLERVIEPYLLVFNAMPRIALVPLFLLWFGLGLGSKIAVGCSLTFFIVLSSTVAGIRSVNQDHLILSHTLGATSRQLFVKVTLPSAVPVMFSGLRLGLIYAMLGVIGAELLAAEHGLGQTLAYLQSTFNMDGVMGVLVLLALLGMSITQGMTRLEQSLLKWQ